MYYAHSTESEDKHDWQLLKDHLENVAGLAFDSASKFNAGKLGKAAGLLHDIGKYSVEFQKRLAGANIKVDHSSAGAIEADKSYDLFYGRILAYLITGHHGGLLDSGSEVEGLKKRLSSSMLPDYSEYENEITMPDLTGFQPELKPVASDIIGFTFSFYIRMLFSCLVDADFLDTEKTLQLEKSMLRGKYDSFDMLIGKFNAHMTDKLSNAKDTPINRRRREIYEQCIQKAGLSQQMFSLTVPTGGGKTLSSMGFALTHLKKHNLHRIFYVIPYTSIIEQNADVFRGIFGNENVLEHHSNYDFNFKERGADQNDPGDNTQEKLKLSSENWDMPIVVTTNVQFFESLFSNKVSKCRKLHNLVNSVIILDEAQMLATGFLKPCLAALSELVVNYGATIVLCTATQPNLNGLLPESVQPTEIMDSPEELYDVFKRVKTTDLGNLSDEELSLKLKMHDQVLCVVNTRKHAQKLYEKISTLEGSYHLSTKMCPAHRRRILSDIKARLDAGLQCHVISTSLIEAGVDIDFPEVYRAMNGIDSVCQCAGRCNREGLLGFGNVYVFRSTEGHGQAKFRQKRLAAIGNSIFNKYDDPLSIPAVNEYFSQLYFYEADALDTEKILQDFERELVDVAFPFESVAHKFKLIADNTADVIIPYDEKAVKILKAIQRTGFAGRYLRSLQGYTVSVYSDEFRALETEGALCCVGERFFVLKKMDYYSPNMGLISQKFDIGDLLLIS